MKKTFPHQFDSIDAIHAEIDKLELIRQRNTDWYIRNYHSADCYMLQNSQKIHAHLCSRIDSLYDFLNEDGNDSQLTLPF